MTELNQSVSSGAPLNVHALACVPCDELQYDRGALLLHQYKSKAKPCELNGLASAIIEEGFTRDDFRSLQTIHSSFNTVRKYSDSDLMFTLAHAAILIKSFCGHAKSLIEFQYSEIFLEIDRSALDAGVSEELSLTRKDIVDFVSLEQ